MRVELKLQIFINEFNIEVQFFFFIFFYHFVHEYFRIKFVLIRSIYNILIWMAN